MKKVKPSQIKRYPDCSKCKNGTSTEYQDLFLCTQNITPIVNCTINKIMCVKYKPKQDGRLDKAT